MRIKIHFPSKLKNLLPLFFLALFFSAPVYAYGGPGVAIGAVVVFITVILAFFASTFISFINLIKRLFKKSKKKYKAKNKK